MAGEFIWCANAPVGKFGWRAFSKECRRKASRPEILQIIDDDERFWFIRHKAAGHEDHVLLRLREFALFRGCGRFSRRQYPEQEGRYFVPRAEGASDLMLDRRHALEKNRDRHRVVVREVRKGVPRHDRGKDAAVRPLSRLQDDHDLLQGPVANPGFLVRRDVSPCERAEPRYLECHIRPTEKLRHIRLSEEISRRMAIVATSESDQVLAPVDLRVSGTSRRHQDR
jgi:hypothetical protein